MSDQWFYRVFGEEFGPMPLEKLKDLAESGTIQPLDDVRSSSGNWMPAVNVDELGLSTSQRHTSTAVATSASDFDVVTQGPADSWYCQIGGTELGPVSFDEIIEFAEKEQIGPDDEVKLGASGKWRRAGSIGRLVSAFPYQAVEKKIESKPAISIGASLPTPPKRPTEGLPGSARQPEPLATASATAPAADMEATYRVAYEQAAAQVAESMMAQADAAYKAAEQQAMSTVAWASQAGVDRYWWGWSNGLEFGPVEFPQVFGLAKSGQLKPSDFVRNGQNGQYVPASSLPGVLTAVASLARAVEARDLAKSQAQAAAKQLPPPATVPVSRINAEKAAAVAATAVPAKSNPSIQTVASASKSSPAVQTIQPAVEPEVAPEPKPAEPVEPVRPASNYGSSSGGFSSSSSSTYSTFGANRPSTPARPAPRRSSASDSTWLADTLENLKDPKAIGSICVLSLILLVVGWGYLPKNRSADIKRYNALKQIADEIQAKRRTAPAELTALQQKLEKTAKEIAKEVKPKANREDLAKLNLLWATHDEVPRMTAAGLGMESQAEKNFHAKLKEVAYELGLEKRPPVDLAMLAAAARED
ncbi:MAG: GYF domain-containing protein [Planctomycetota bacterium]